MASMYTNKALVEDIVARPRLRARVYNSERREVYAELWQAVALWMEWVWRSGKTANIPAFATVGWELYRPTPASAVARRPYFSFTKHFLRASGEAADGSPPFLSKVVEFDPLRVAIKFSARLNKDIVAAGLNDLLECLSDAFKARKQLSMEFPIGRLLVSTDHSVKFYFDAATRDRVLKEHPIPRTTMALFEALNGEPTASRPLTMRSDMSRLDSHRPGTRAPFIPPLALSSRPPMSSFDSGAPASQSRTKRSAVLEAAYERHLELIKKRQADEVRAQELYDKDVTDYDRTLFERRNRHQQYAHDHLQQLLNQAEEGRKKKQEARDFERAPGWDDENGSILPTQGIAKLAKYLDHPLPPGVDTSRIPAMDLACMKAEFAEKAAKKKQQAELYKLLTTQVITQAKAKEDARVAEVVKERRTAHDLMLKQVSESKAAWEKRMEARRTLKASWNRDIELQRAIKENAKQAARKQQQWRSTHLANTSKRVGAGIFSPHSTPLTGRSLATSRSAGSLRSFRK